MKRRLFAILLFLLLGALVNLSVAWGLALTRNPVGLPITIGIGGGPSELWQIWRAKEPGTVTLYSIHRSMEPEEHVWGIQADMLCPYWCDMDTPTDLYYDLKDPIENRLIEARGWPSLTLYFERSRRLLEFEDADESIVTLHEGRDIGGIPTPLPPFDTDTSRVLPYLPIWPGFAINTIVYAAALWLLIPGPFVLRRQLRRRRGHCLKCGYDLRGDYERGCPECGWNRQDATT